MAVVVVVELKTFTTGCTAVVEFVKTVGLEGEVAQDGLIVVVVLLEVVKPNDIYVYAVHYSYNVLV